MYVFTYVNGCELNFIRSKIRTIAWETAFQTALRNWFKETEEKSQQVCDFGEGVSSVQFSCSVVSNSLRPHELQHARPPYPWPTPGVHSNSHPSSRWCQPAISSSGVPFSSCPQSLPASEFFSSESTLHMRWPKYWSFSFSIILSKEHPGLISFKLDWLDLFAVQKTLKSFLQHCSSKPSILRRSAFFTV